MLDAERTVELAIETRVPELALRRDVGKTDRALVACALPVHDERVVRNVCGQHSRRIGEIRVRPIRCPADRALREVQLGVCGQRRRNEPGQLRGHVRPERMGPRHRAGAVDELENAQEVALARRFHDARDSDSAEGGNRSVLSSRYGGDPPRVKESESVPDSPKPATKRGPTAGGRRRA